MSTSYLDNVIVYLIEADVINGIPGNIHYCIAGRMASRELRISAEEIEVAIHEGKDDIIPRIRWVIDLPDGREVIHQADITPLGIARKIVLLNDERKKRSLFNSIRKNGPIKIILTNHTAYIKQYGGGSPDDPVRRKARKMLRENHPGKKFGEIPDAAYQEISEAIGCQPDKIADTHKRMRNLEPKPRNRYSRPKRFGLINPAG